MTINQRSIENHLPIEAISTVARRPLMAVGWNR
jgi:hypothetical protein